MDSTTEPNRMTRADLMQRAAWRDCATDTNGNPVVWSNSYHCPDCAETWHDAWSCKCDDQCPTCGADCQPEASFWIGPDDIAEKALFLITPEAS